MITAIGGNAEGGGSQWRYVKGIMQHEVTQSSRFVNGDKAFLRQLHQKFTRTLGQVSAVREEIARWMMKKVDLGKDMEAIVVGLVAERSFRRRRMKLEGAH